MILQGDHYIDLVSFFPWVGTLELCGVVSSLGVNHSVWLLGFLGECVFGVFPIVKQAICSEKSPSVQWVMLHDFANIFDLRKCLRLFLSPQNRNRFQTQNCWQRVWGIVFSAGVGNILLILLTFRKSCNSWGIWNAISKVVFAFSVAYHGFLPINSASQKPKKSVDPPQWIFFPQFTVGTNHKISISGFRAWAITSIPFQVPYRKLTYPLPRQFFWRWFFPFPR